MALFDTNNAFLIDKALIIGQDYELTSSGDLAMVLNEENYLQAAQTRILSDNGSWLYDTKFGSEMRRFLSEEGALSVTDEKARSYIEKGLEDMLTDGRISEVNDVKIVDRSEDTIWIEITVTVGTMTGSILYELNF